MRVAIAFCSAALAQEVTLRAIGEAAKATAIRLALAEENGNVRRAARRLGVTDRALQMRRAGQARRRTDLNWGALGTGPDPAV